MNKKFVQAIACLSFLVVVFLVPQLTKATCSSCSASSTASSGYNTPVYKSELNFKAVYSNGQVATSWNAYEPEGFNYYKVIRSTTNENPVYPDDSYIYAGSSGSTSYIDKTPPAGTVYYRVCSIAKPNRYCSIVIAVSSDGSSSAVMEPVKSTSSSPDPADLSLKATMGSDGVQLSWAVNGESPQGFKLAISTLNENPTYPVIAGDTYRYFTDAGKRSYKEVMLKAGETYHYRICQYFSGECLSYSNSVSVEVPEDYVKPSTKEIITTELTGTKTVNQFSDTAGHKYAFAINYLMDNSIVVGYDDGTFLPDNSINRAEFVKIIVEAKYPNTATAAFNNCFPDVKNDWYAAYVCLAKEKDIIHGYPDGTFKPANNINFVEAAKILYEVYGLSAEEGDYWYIRYVRALENDNYIPPTVDRFNKLITRAEMAELIWRIREQKKDQESIEFLSKNIEGPGYTGNSKVYNGGDFYFNHPSWYVGEKWGRTILTDELDFYQNLNTPNYMDVDSYMTVYSVSGTDLNTDIWADHSLVSSQELTINGVKALKRHFRAPRGTVVNGRTTGENENITVYSYLVNDRIVVLEYFNAYGTENKNVEIFIAIAESFVAHTLDTNFIPVN